MISMKKQQFDGSEIKIKMLLSSLPRFCGPSADTCRNKPGRPSVFEAIKVTQLLKHLREIVLICRYGCSKVAFTLTDRFHLGLIRAEAPL